MCSDKFYNVQIKSRHYFVHTPEDWTADTLKDMLYTLSRADSFALTPADVVGACITEFHISHLDEFVHEWL